MQLIPVVHQKDYHQAVDCLSRLIDHTRLVQIDVEDSSLTPNKTFELELLNKIDLNYTFLWDIHLMVKEPIHWLKKCLFVGATRIIGQIEMMSDPSGFVATVQDNGLEAGLAFDIATPISSIPHDTNLVLLMSRPMGFEPHPLDPKVFDKIKAIKEAGFTVAIDGGANLANIDKLIQTKVDIIYSETAFFDLYAHLHSN